MMRMIAQMSIVSLLLSVASATAAEVSMKNIPQEAVDEMAFRVGEWEFRPFIDGVELPDSGHEVTTWSPTGKYCIIMTQTAVESGASRAGTGIAGWDPAKKQLVERWQSSDGMYLSFHYTIDRRRNSRQATSPARTRMANKSAANAASKRAAMTSGDGTLLGLKTARKGPGAGSAEE